MEAVDSIDDSLYRYVHVFFVNIHRISGLELGKHLSHSMFHLFILFSLKNS